LINLFDPELQVLRSVTIHPGSRYLLLDLDSPLLKADRPLASACKVVRISDRTFAIEGIANTQGILLLRADKAPRKVLLAGEPLNSFKYSATDQLLWIRFPNSATPRELRVE
jgi:hypothetical protein